LNVDEPDDVDGRHSGTTANERSLGETSTVRNGGSWDAATQGNVSLE
jgi:hypothetical protein